MIGIEKLITEAIEWACTTDGEIPTHHIHLIDALRDEAEAREAVAEIAERKTIECRALERKIAKLQKRLDQSTDALESLAGWIGDEGDGMDWDEAWVIANQGLK